MRKNTQPVHTKYSIIFLSSILTHQVDNCLQFILETPTEGPVNPVTKRPPPPKKKPSSLYTVPVLIVYVKWSKRRYCTLTSRLQLNIFRSLKQNKSILLLNLYSKNRSFHVNAHCKNNFYTFLGFFTLYQKKEF